MLNSDDFNVKLMIIICPSPILATNDVAAILGRLGPGESGPGQLGPGQLGPGQLGPGPNCLGPSYPFL